VNRLSGDAAANEAVSFHGERRNQSYIGDEEETDVDKTIAIRCRLDAGHL
jgi:hypothetical protein